MPAVIALLFMAVQTHAGEIEPRAYVNTPVEINFLLAATVCEARICIRIRGWAQHLRCP